MVRPARRIRLITFCGCCRSDFADFTNDLQYNQSTMLIPRLLYKRELLNLAHVCAPARCVQHATEIDIVNVRMKLPAHQEKKPQRAPFMKNLFIGVIDEKFLTYPESQVYDRFREFTEWIRPVEGYMSRVTDENLVQNTTNDDILSGMHELNVLRSRVGRLYEGLDFSDTEICKLLEVVSPVPWLGTYLVKNNFSIVDLIAKHGAASHKAKYLPKIATGAYVPTICITEQASGPNVNTINTVATSSDCGNYWLLNGEKTFVANGNNSNLYLVFAKCLESGGSFTENKTLSLFVVERDYGGVSYKDVEETVGQQGVSLCAVSFTDTPVPKENLIQGIGDGASMLIDVFAPGSQIIAPRAIAALRNFTNILIKHALDRKHHDQNMYQMESAQKVISDMACNLYGMESVLYLTTGMSDCFKDQDVALERSIVEYYCATQCVENIYKGLQLIGAQSYLRKNPFVRIYEDALAFTTFDSYTDDARSLIALLGLQYAGKHIHEHVTKRRNPFLYPDYAIKNMFKGRKKAQLYLEGFLHPSLKEPAYMLEICIDQLRTTTEYLLQRYGAEISYKHFDLHRLSEMATSIYVLVAVLGRASRAYCTGIRNADCDRVTAIAYGYVTLSKVESMKRQIYEGDVVNGDLVHKNVAQLTYDGKKYFAQHPLERNG